jgi:hypothetical protein
MDKNLNWIKFETKPWRRGAVDIASASGTRRPGFESRQGIRFLGKHGNAVAYKMTLYALFVCRKEKKGTGHIFFNRDEIF